MLCFVLCFQVLFLHLLLLGECGTVCFAHISLHCWTTRDPDRLSFGSPFPLFVEYGKDLSGLSHENNL
jgi:hypothetical protein